MPARSWIPPVLIVAVAVVAVAAAVAGVARRASPERPAAAWPGPPDAAPGPAEPADWFVRQRAFPSGRIDGEALARAVGQAQAMGARAGGGLVWEAAGPTNVGGRVTAVAAAGATVYVGTGSGGVFRTADGGATFTPVGADAFTLSIGDVAVDPQNPETVYVGTGEANGGGGSLTYGGSGLYRSADGGASWALLGLDGTGSIGRVVVHPTDATTLWVAAAGSLYQTDDRRGVYRSADGGASWARTLAVNDSTGAIDLAVNPRAPDTLYTATWERRRSDDDRRYGGAGSGVWRSADGGASWTRLAGGLPSGPDVGRIGLAVAPSRPNVVYAIATDATGYLRGLYRTENGGDTWTGAVPPIQNPSYGWWFGQVRVDPTDWRRVYLPWLDLYASTDAGASFAFASGTMHADHHALWIDPANPSRLISGNDGGLYFSSTRAGSWAKATGGFPVTQFYTVEIDPYRAGALIGGTQDNGTVRTLGAANAWTDVFGGDGHYTRFDRALASTFYVAYQYGNLFRTSNDGASFASISPPGARFNWSAPLELSPFDPATIYYGAERVFASANRGATWTAVSPDLTDGDTPGELTFGTITSLSASPAAAGRLWAGTDDGHVWTTAGGGAWTDVSAGLPTRWITRVTAHPTDPLQALVAQSGFRDADATAALFRTADGGQTWAAIGADLPEAPVNDVLYDPDTPATLYAATDVGVFVSADGGATWATLAAGLPVVPVTDLDLEGRRLAAATFGRGVFVTELLPVAQAAGPTASALRVSISPNPASGPVRVRVGGGPLPGVRVEAFAADGRRVAVLYDGPLGAGGRDVRWDARSLARGVYTVRATGGGAARTARVTLVR